MSMKFPGSARTIIKSRIRRHADRDAICGTNPKTITDATVADLGQFALALGLDAPTQAECEVYDRAKAAGHSATEATAAADTHAIANHLGGEGMLRLECAGVSVPHLDDTDAETPDAPDADAEPTSAPTPEDEQKAKADADAKAVLAAFGGGDMSGFQERLSDLAMRANRPDPAPQVIQQAAIDPAKIQGHVPQVIAKMDMQAAGIAAPAHATLEATKLDQYDAPDAPAIDPEYVWSEHAAPALAALAAGENVFLTGPAGTGKTTFAKQIAARYGRPFVRISCNDQTDAPTLVGMPGLKDGATTWEDGQLAAAVRRPGTVILIDEPSAARPGALMILQGVLDDDRTLAIADTGERIPVAPGVLFLAADNTAGTGDESGAYEGTRTMNRATLDRFALTIPIKYLPAKQETKLLQARAGLDATRAGHLVRLANATRKAAEQGDLSHGMGFRRLAALGKAVAAGVHAPAAFQLAVLQTAPYDDREPLRQIWTSEIGKHLDSQ